MERNYNYTAQLKEIWDKSIEYYNKGGRNALMFFNGVELEFLRSIGATPGDVYDFVEDLCEQGEPTWETFLLVQAVRRDYLFSFQHGQHATSSIKSDDLPAKTDVIRDIAWLPRIIAKAKAKLHGELPTTIMYGCGGDRRFLKSHDIHPADFLRGVWAYEDDEPALIDWFVAQSSRLESPS